MCGGYCIQPINTVARNCFLVVLILVNVRFNLLLLPEHVLILLLLLYICGVLHLNVFVYGRIVLHYNPKLVSRLRAIISHMLKLDWCFMMVYCAPNREIVAYPADKNSLTV